MHKQQAITRINDDPVHYEPDDYARTRHRTTMT